MNVEVMKLYKDYGVNPVGGCLPMLVQIPIFFGFYNMLGKAVELRNAKFLWVHDLSQPDTICASRRHPGQRPAAAHGGDDALAHGVSAEVPAIRCSSA